MQEDMIPVRLFDGDPNIYISVFNRVWKWYYYNPDNASLGEGAMGKVFIGYDYDTNQKVAIKQLFDRIRQCQIRKGQVSSVKASSITYTHPNIVEMLGSCMYEDEDGYWHVWILSNYVDGVNIDKYVRGLGNDADKVQIVTSLVGDVLNALDYLHSKGVIHRDIKPSNIMVDKTGHVKLMDLGIARVTSANSYTSTGFVGTPLYASPEQIMRDKMLVQATPASDIYSLGMTLYVLLNGEHPFDADTEAQILVNQVTKKLPMAKSLEKKYRKLMDVIWKATDKDPDKRFQKALDFKYAIEKAMEPVMIPWWYFVLGVLVIGLIIGIIILNVI